MFPYCWEVSIRIGQVEKVGEVVDAQRTKMLELVNVSSSALGAVELELKRIAS